MILAPLCRLNDGKARQVIGEVLDATADWRTVAANNGLPAGEIAQFEESFDQRRHLISTFAPPPH